MKQRYTMQHRVALFLCFFTLLGITIPEARGGTTFDDVYQITDLSNRGLDVILRKSKGVKQPVLPKWTEKDLGRFHVYQLQIACIDEIRWMESKFKMTPYPHIIVSPGPLSEKNLYKVSAIILSEIRRIAIHLNIWGLPKQKRSFSGENTNSIFEETLALYLKLRVLGGRHAPTPKETSAAFKRGIADIKILLNHIDPARRYQDVFPFTTKQSTSQSYAACLTLRKELNGVKALYKLPTTRPPQANKKPSVTDLFTQSQIILGELNQIKTAAKAGQPAMPVAEPSTDNIAQQINILHKLISQVKPLTNLQGGK